MRKKFLTKLLGTLCAAIITFASAYMLSGCGTMYHSKAGTMQDMIGTYQLTTYKQKDDDGNEIDRIKQLHVKAYMVVGADGHGYYYYQDDTTPYWYDTTLIRYTKENENSNLYKAIQMTKGVSDRDTKIDRQKPGNGYEPPMGFNVNTKTFNYTIPDDRHPRQGFYPSYYTHVVYTKISNDTNLNKIAHETHQTLDPLPTYELKNLDGVLVFHAGMPNHAVAPTVTNPQYNQYKYYIADFDALNQTADIYYELIDGSVQQEKNVPIDVTFNTLENGTRQLVVKFFNEEYTATINFGSAPRYLNHEVNTPFDETGTSYNVYNNTFEKYYDNTATAEEVIAIQLENYNNSQN